MPKPIKIPPITILQYISLHISYDPDTGILIKNGKPVGSKRKGDNCVILPLTIGKDPEGHAVRYSGYASQVAWYLTHGEWPDKWIDHIDGDRGNNRLNNLRLVSPQQNSSNQRKVYGITTSKFKGVQRRTAVLKKPWRAYIVVKGKRIELGHYATEAGAARAYDTKAVEMFGEYAKLNFGENSAISNDMRQLPLCFDPKPILPTVSTYHKVGYARGEQTGLSKLTEEQVREIKLLLPVRYGFGYTDIGKIFGVSGANIKAIAQGKTWRHIQV